jgi:hypothetical protein
MIIPPDQMSFVQNANFSEGAIQLGEDSLEAWTKTSDANEVHRFIMQYGYGTSILFRIWHGKTIEAIGCRSSYTPTACINGRTQRVGDDVPEVRKHHQLTEAEWNRFQGLLTDLKFWDDVQWQEKFVVGDVPLRLFEGWNNGAYKLRRAGLCKELDQLFDYFRQLFELK